LPTLSCLFKAGEDAAEFNPIEHCWSKIKNILRKIGARTYPDLAQAIEFAFHQISLKDIRNWFAHCC
jgi:transposase